MVCSWNWRTLSRLLSSVFCFIGLNKWCHNWIRVKRTFKWKAWVCIVEVSLSAAGAAGATAEAWLNCRVRRRTEALQKMNTSELAESACESPTSWRTEPSTLCILTMCSSEEQKPFKIQILRLRGKKNPAVSIACVKHPPSVFEAVTVVKVWRNVLLVWNRCRDCEPLASRLVLTPEWRNRKKSCNGCQCNPGFEMSWDAFQGWGLLHRLRKENTSVWLFHHVLLVWNEALWDKNCNVPAETKKEPPFKIWKRLRWGLRHCRSAGEALMCCRWEGRTPSGAGRSTRVVKKNDTSFNVCKVELKNNDNNDLVPEAASPRPRLLPTCCYYTRSFSATMAAILLTDVRVRLRSPQ